MRSLARWLPLIGAFATVAVVVAILVTQGAPPARPPDIDTEGPPRVRTGAVDAHARQFDDELPDRPAGSQEEFAAASYIVGHLQRAGYVTRLESVPVANAVRSTDVLALPPSGSDPLVLVTVAFDSPERAPGTGGAAIGLFLELARALNVSAPRHDVGFAALGAERTSRSGGHLGSRRLAQLLIEQEQDPLIVSIDSVGGGELRVRARLLPDELDLGPRATETLALPGRDVFTRAGLEHVSVSGPADTLGPTLVRALRSD